MNYSGIVNRTARAAAVSKNDDDRSPSEFGALTSVPAISLQTRIGDTWVRGPHQVNRFQSSKINKNFRFSNYKVECISYTKKS